MTPTSAKAQRQLKKVQGLSALRFDHQSYYNGDAAPSFGNLYGLDDDPKLVSINPKNAQVFSIVESMWITPEWLLIKYLCFIVLFFIRFIIGL